MCTNQALFAPVVRGYENVSYYEVWIGKRGMSDSRVIRIDGNNGKILSDRIQPYLDGGEHYRHNVK